MNYIEYYTKFRNERNNLNEELCIEAAAGKEGWLITKIEGAIERDELLNTTVSQALKDIESKDKYALARFKKPPSKQNISEETQVLFAKEYGDIELTKPDGHWYVEDGEFVSKFKATEETRNNMKSFDFKAEIKGQQYALTAKVTNNGGGGQDGTKLEMSNTIKSYDEYVNKHPDKKCIFILLLDGTYFSTEKRAMLKRAIVNKTKILILSSDELILLNK